MPANSFTYNLDEILSTTLLNWRNSGKMYDNIFKANPTMKFLHAPGRKKTEPGGERIMVPLQKGKSTTGGSYSRYGVIDITPQDNQTAVYYEWRQYGNSIVIDGLSEFQNKAPHRIKSLLGAKIMEVETSTAEDINEQLWKSAPGSDDILSLTSLIVRAPGTTDAASPGGVAGSTYSWWRNQTKTSAATTWKGVVVELRNLYNLCKKGPGGFPNGAITNQETYEYVENHMADNVRYVDPDMSSASSKRSPAFENIRWKGATLFWDEHVPDAYGNATTAYDWDNASVTYGSLFFINTKYLWYTVGEGHDLKVGKFVSANVAGQDAKLSLLTHYHQLCCSQRRKHGVLEKISKSLTS